jgi:hypothetical protein
MRFVVITRLMSVVPPEQLTAIMERFAEWREEYKDRTDTFEFFRRRRQIHACSRFRG